MDELPPEGALSGSGQGDGHGESKDQRTVCWRRMDNPYRLPVGDFLRKGENLIEVEVVNNWRNRLIGDASLPEKERGTWTNVNPWNADSPLQSSGLIGPVEIQAYSYE